MAARENILQFYPDIPEDVLGGLNAAVTQMTWRNENLFHVHYLVVVSRENAIGTTFLVRSMSLKRWLIGDFSVFDLVILEGNPEALVSKFSEATCSTINTVVSLRE
ncbi:8011_t:CDS:2 [Funneliformis caledonium]|uniref:8011_t:CDS:1 n=1 Tax=Funneliformis caledonium TaxID=1117310 RepID=A0A9N9C757_9GLOM|nr:8011_t:CDS:2 [Funneliformis caledonium]